MNEIDLIRAMKRASNETREAQKPVRIELGTVVSASPIRVQISQKLTLTDMQLIIPQGLTKYTVAVTDEENVTKQLTIDNSLKNGDKVLLIRQDGGQKYAIIDKVVSA